MNESDDDDHPANQKAKYSRYIYSPNSLTIFGLNVFSTASHKTENNPRAGVIGFAFLCLTQHPVQHLPWGGLLEGAVND